MWECGNVGMWEFNNLMIWNFSDWLNVDTIDTMVHFGYAQCESMDAVDTVFGLKFMGLKFPESLML